LRRLRHWWRRRRQRLSRHAERRRADAIDAASLHQRLMPLDYHWLYSFTPSSLFWGFFHMMRVISSDISFAAFHFIESRAHLLLWLPIISRLPDSLLPEISDITVFSDYPSYFSPFPQYCFQVHTVFFQDCFFHVFRFYLCFMVAFHNFFDRYLSSV